MKSRAVVSLLVVVVLVGCGAASSSASSGGGASEQPSLSDRGTVQPSGSGSAGGCQPGTQTLNGAQVPVFCGPARATVLVGGKTLEFKDGSCDLLPDTWTVNLGTFSGGDPRPDYFGVTIFQPSGDKTYLDATIVWVKDGVEGGLRYGPESTLTLTNNMRKGEIKGKLSGTSTDVTGTINCD